MKIPDTNKEDMQQYEDETSHVWKETALNSIQAREDGWSISSEGDGWAVKKDTPEPLPAGQTVWESGDDGPKYEEDNEQTTIRQDYIKQAEERLKATLEDPKFDEELRKGFSDMLIYGREEYHISGDGDITHIAQGEIGPDTPMEVRPVESWEEAVRELREEIAVPVFHNYVKGEGSGRWVPDVKEVPVSPYEALEEIAGCLRFTANACGKEPIEVVKEEILAWENKIQISIKAGYQIKLTKL